MNNENLNLEAILKNLKTDKEVSPGAAFRTNARIRLLNIITNPPSVVPARSLRPLMWKYALAFAILIFLISGSTVYAAQYSHPQDLLFPVKSLSERAALTLSPTESLKTSVAMTIIQRRVTESETAQKEGNADEIKLTTTNFESSVSEIRKNPRIDHRQTELEISKHAGLFPEEKESNDDVKKSDIKGAESNTEQNSSVKINSNPSVTPIQENKVEQLNREHTTVSPNPEQRGSTESNIEFKIEEK